MVSFTALLAACAAIAGVTAAPDSLAKRQVTPNQEGTHNGYFFSWWSDGASPVTYTNTDGGGYTVEWQPGGNLVGGKGWNPGTGRTIEFSATWNPENNGNSYLAIYGWTRNPLVEYYVMEAHGEYNPGSAGQNLGSVTVDGASYTIYQATRYNAPSIDGTQTFQQYFAVRDQHRTSGSVNMQSFFDAWASKGLNLGTHYYQIFATEAYNSRGNAQVEVLTPA